MRAFIFYEPQSGKVVHVHFQPAELDINVDEIFAMVDPKRESRLEVLELPRPNYRSAALQPKAV